MPPARSSPPVFLQHTFVLGRSMLASRILGFTRDALLAALLGVGGVADAFLLAFRAPNFFRRLLAEGSLSYALVPELVRLHSPPAAPPGEPYAPSLHPPATDGLCNAFALGRAMLWTSVTIFSIVAVILFFSANAVVTLMAPGLRATPATLAQAGVFLALCLPYLPLSAGAAISSGILVSMGKAADAARAPLAFNCVLITACLGLLLAPSHAAYAPHVLCAAVVAAGAVQWLSQMPPLARVGFRLLPAGGHGGNRGHVSHTRRARRARLARLARVLRATPTAAFGAATHQISLLAATMLASFLGEGSIAVLYFAERLMEFPLGILGASLGLASLTDLAGHAHSGDRGPFRAALGQAVQLAVFLSLPAATGLALLAGPIVALLFGHGAFSDAAQRHTADALAAYALGLPALISARPLLSALTALKKTRATAVAGLASCAVTLAVGACLLPLGSTAALACALSLGGWVALAVLLASLRRCGCMPLPRLWPYLTSMAGSAALVFWLYTLGQLNLSPLPHVLAAVPGGALLYFCLTWLLGSGEAGLCVRALLSARRP